MNHNRISAYIFLKKWPESAVETLTKKMLAIITTLALIGSSGTSFVSEILELHYVHFTEAGRFCALLIALIFRKISHHKKATRSTTK